MKSIPDGGAAEGSYRPVGTFTNMLDYSLWKLAPSGHRLTNVLFHFFNAVLIYFLIKRVTGRQKLSMWTSLLFVVSPVSSEVIHVVSFREDLLVVFFCLSSLFLYIRLKEFFGWKKVVCYLASLGLFFLGLFTKELAACLPLLMVLYDYLYGPEGGGRRPRKRTIFLYSGYILVLLFYVWVRFFVIVDESLPAMEYPGGNLYTSMLTMSKVIVFYIFCFIWPINLPTIMPLDSFMVTNSFFAPGVLPAMLFVAFCLLAAVKTRNTSREISFGIFWFFLALLPMSNIFPIRNFMAMRYLYMPAIGFFIVITALVLLMQDKIKRLPSAFSKILLIFALVFYSAVTVTNNFYWKNNRVLLKRVVEKYPHFIKARRVLGESYKDEGMPEQAVEEYEAILTLEPDDQEAHINAGISYLMMANTEGNSRRQELAKKAVNHLRYGLKARGEDPRFLNNLGIAYALAGDEEEAKKMWERALALKPGYEEARKNLEKMGE